MIECCQIQRKRTKIINPFLNHIKELTNICEEYCGFLNSMEDILYYDSLHRVKKEHLQIKKLHFNPTTNVFTINWHSNDFVLDNGAANFARRGMGMTTYNVGTMPIQQIGPIRDKLNCNILIEELEQSPYLGNFEDYNYVYQFYYTSSFYMHKSLNMQFENDLHSNKFQLVCTKTILKIDDEHEDSQWNLYKI